MTIMQSFKELEKEVYRLTDLLRESADIGARIKETYVRMNLKDRPENEKWADVSSEGSY